MSTKRTDVIIRTQINILSVFDNIYIFLSRVNQRGGGGCQMLVLALERATDGHDSRHGQMALAKMNLKQVTAFRI